MATRRALLLQLVDQSELVLRAEAGCDLVDAELGGDRLGRGLVVAGRHDDLEPERVELGDGLGGGGLIGSATATKPASLPSSAEKHHRLAVLASRFCGVGERRDIDAGPLHQPRIAEQRRAAADASLHALPGDRLEASVFGDLQASCFGAAEDRLGKGMLAARFERGGEAQHLVVARSLAPLRRRSAPACPRSGCRSCRRPAYRRRRAAPAPRHCAPARRPARRVRSPP